MKSHKKLLSLILSVSTLFCCFTNLFVKASGIDVSDYTYVVDNMIFYQGEKQINSPKGATEVAVDVTRRVAGGDSDRLIISTHTDDGEFLGMYSVIHHVDFGKTSTVRVFMNVPDGKSVGEVRAYVWKSFSDMTPLSNSLSSNNNMIIDPKLEYEKELQTEFTDVSVNDSFADAVSFMAYLGIMNGYEDGTFRPTSNIRVADAARMITYMTKGEIAASILENETLVADEIPSSIERGYINYCVDAKYLTPDENGYVNYDSNITTSEFLKLTVNALGYADLAKAYGGWPRGYISVATQYGIADVSGLNYSENITRATAAQILYSAIDAPIVLITGTSYTDNGTMVPRFAVQDGLENSVYFKSLLTEKFGIYKVEGFVTKISKDDGSGLKADEVNFGIAKSKKYVNEDVRYTTTITNYHHFFIADEGSGNYAADRILRHVNIGNTDAANHKAVYATAYLKPDDNNKWEIVKFIPSDKNSIVEFDVKDADKELAGTSYDLGTDYDSKPFLKFFVDGATTSTKYPLNELSSVKVYVNGVEVGINAATSKAAIENYILADSAVGNVKLVDTYETDGKIDAIYVNRYLSGMLRNVTSDGTINFQIGADAGLTSITLDEENDEIAYVIYYNGEEITVDELMENDVLTIAYDPLMDFENSGFYEIYVSRDVVKGTLKSKNDEDAKIKLGDKYYEFAKISTYHSFANNNEVGDECILYLDAFGRVFKGETDLSAIDWAIAEKFIINSGAGDEEYKLTIFTAEGATKTYYFDASKATVTLEDGSEINKTTEGSANALNEAVKNHIYTTYLEKQPLSNRVIQYKVNASSGKITELKFIPATSVTYDKEAYDATNKKIGALKMNDSTKLIDATEYVIEQKTSDLVATSLEMLADEAEYEAIAYGYRMNDGSYPFVIITASSVSPMNYAIVEGFTEGDNLETCYINLYNPKEDYYEQISFAETSKITTPTGGTFYADEYYILDDFWDEITSIIYDEDSNLSDITQRIVSYRLSYNYPNNIISELKFLPYTSSVTSMTSFDSDTNTIGNISLSENALMVDVSNTENDEINVFTPQSFTNGRECKAYAYDKNSDNVYPFVLITEASEYNAYNWGIAEKFIINTGAGDEEYKLTIFADDGTTKEYYFDASKATVTLADGTEINKTSVGSATALNETVKALVHTTGTSKQALTDRVIQYKVNASSGKITKLEFLPLEANTLAGTNGRMEYSEGNKTIGDINLSDTTKIINASDYWKNNEICPVSIDDLYDGTSYEAYAYGEMTDGAHPFVLITMANISDSAYAIAENFTTATTIGATKISLYNVNEEHIETLSFNSTDTKITFSDGTTKHTADYSSVSDFCYQMSALTNAEVSVTDRIVSYRINYDTGYIKEITFIPVSKITESISKYNATTKTIGDISLTDDALIVDASEAGFGTYDSASYIDGIECEAAFYNADDDGKYSLAVITAITSMPDAPVNWAIAEKFVINTGAGDEEYKLTIFTAEGATKAYYFDASKATVTLADGTEINKMTEGSATALNEAVNDIIYDETFSKTAIENRVIQYKVNSSSGKIVSLKFIPSSGSTTNKEEYDASNKKIGALKMSDSTKLIDATEYVIEQKTSDLVATSLEMLVDEVDYEAIAFGERNDDRTYPFIIITAGEATYNAKTRFAVITEAGYTIAEDEDGNTVYNISAMAGAETTLVASDEVAEDRLDALRPGEVIFYQVDASGKVKDFDYLLNWVVSSGKKTIPTYAQLANWSLVPENKDNNIASGALMNIISSFNSAKFGTGKFTTDWDDNTNDIIKIVYGPVISISNTIAFAKIDASGNTNVEDDVQEYDLAQDMNVYTYDFKNGAKYRFDYRETDISAIRATEVYEYEYDGVTIDWDKDFGDGYESYFNNMEKATFALAVVVNDEVQDIFAFMAK